MIINQALFKGKSDFQIWTKIYGILYPDVPPAEYPSPCKCHSNYQQRSNKRLKHADLQKYTLEQFVEYTIENLPNVFAPKLDQIYVNANSTPSSRRGEIIGKAREALKMCLLEINRSWNSSRRPPHLQLNSCNPPSMMGATQVANEDHILGHAAPNYMLTNEEYHHEDEDIWGSAFLNDEAAQEAAKHCIPDELNLGDALPLPGTENSHRKHSFRDFLNTQDASQVSYFIEDSGYFSLLNSASLGSSHSKISDICAMIDGLNDLGNGGGQASVGIASNDNDNIGNLEPDADSNVLFRGMHGMTEAGEHHDGTTSNNNNDIGDWGPDIDLDELLQGILPKTEAEKYHDGQEGLWPIFEAGSTQHCAETISTYIS